MINSAEIMSKKEIFSFAVSLSVLFLSLLVCLSNAQTDQVQNNDGNNVFEVGVVLDLSSLVGRIGLTSLSLALSDFYNVNRNYSTRLVLHVRDSKGQIIDATAAAIGLLKDVKVDAIIGPQKSSQASSVIGLGDRANVPIILFSATSPYLHSQSPYFLQTSLSDASQVGAIAAITDNFRWSQVVLIHEESDYGNGIIPYLSNAFQDVNTRISYRSVIPLSATDDFMLQELYKMKTMQTRVFVVHMSSSLASRFFPKVKEAGMMSKGYAWIVTSGLMDLLYSLDSNVVETMDGVIGVKPQIPRSRKLFSTARRWRRKFLHDNPGISQAELNSYGVWAYDTLWALAMAAESVRLKVPSSLPNNSSTSNATDLFATPISETGPKFLKAMSEVTFQGLGGKFHLVNGQLGSSPFQIVNVVGNRNIEVGIWTPSQGISGESASTKMLRSIMFPGSSIETPRGWEVPLAGNKLQVAVPAEAGFPSFFRWEKDPQTNISEVRGAYIDMFNAVMANLPYAVPYEYLKFEGPNGSSDISYDELVRQVSLQKYDIGMGDLTITSARSENVDFSLPFAAGGITVTVPVRYEDPNNKWIFLKPFTKDLWLTAIALFIMIGGAIWLIEHRFNSAYRGPPSQHAGMIFYFPFMSLVFAQRERIVNNLARVVVVVWMFNVLVLSSTFTASLSARLTVQRLLPAVTDVKELIRRGDYVGVREGSFLFSFVQGLGFERNKIRSYKSPEDINEALSTGSDKGGISALFSVMPYTKLFLSKYCDKYTTVEQIYPTEGFAYVFQKGSPLVADVSRAVIKLTENGRISEIEAHWIKNQACDGSDGTIAKTSVSLQSFKALFAITGAITAACVLVFLILYLYDNRDFFRRIWNSDSSTWSKVRAICNHFDQRDPKSFRSKAREDDGENASPDRIGIPRSSTVVPVSSIELGDIDGDITPSPQHTPVVGQRGSPSVHFDNITVAARRQL